MKRVGYPEDSTQSAYSSQLIRIPLSAIIFYLSRFISREATTRQRWGGDQNQLLVVVVVVGWGRCSVGWGGGVWRRTQTHASPSTSPDRRCLHQIRWWRVVSRAALVPLLIPTSSARFVSFCLGRRRRVSSTRRVKEPIVWARLTSRPRLKPSPRKARSFNSEKKERGRQGEVLRKHCKLSFRKSPGVARWKSLKWMSLFPCQTVFSTSGFRKLNGREIPMVTCKSPSSLSRPLIVLRRH